MSLYTTFQNVISSFGMEQSLHPTFYNSPLAIRFNIGDNGNEAYIHKDNGNFEVNPKYLTTCLERSLKIYNSLKTPPDLLVIEGHLNEDETVEDFIAALLSSTDLPQPNELKKTTVRDNEDQYTHLFLFWDLDDFCPDKLFKEIILADLESGNYFLTSSVYFVCTTENLLFHLYDDRGADLAADKKEKIQHIYSKLNDLILDYDRKKIDSIFKAPAE